MHPAETPAHANAAERAIYAALALSLPATATCWFQARLPGRNNHLSFQADFLLLDEKGVLIIEVKGWHAVSISSADESRVVFRNGTSAQHPLLQAFRYQAALLELFRQVGAPVVPIRSVAACPFISVAELGKASWSGSFPREKMVLRDDLGLDLYSKVAATPPLIDTILSPRQLSVINSLISSAAASGSVADNAGFQRRLL